MVYILQQLTREVTGLVARVHDADGEFLLIEAADYLPSWANPDTCENRVSLSLKIIITEFKNCLVLLDLKSTTEDFNCIYLRTKL